jgi:hypothetical protein
MKFIVPFAFVIAVSLPAAAQTLPNASSDPLKDICTGFLGQSGQGISGDQNKLCACLVRETQSRLTKTEMEAYARAGQTGQQPPPAVMQKVMSVATACLTEAAR